MKKLIFIIVCFFIGFNSIAQATNSAKDAAKLYKKGLHAMKNNQCQIAKKYFNQAIQIIPQDNRNLRTFGRTTTKYFPNKRLKKLKCPIAVAKTQKIDIAPKITKTTPVKIIKNIPLSIKINKPKINHRKGTVLISGSITGQKNSQLKINKRIVPIKNQHFSLKIPVPYGKSSIQFILTHQQQQIKKHLKVKRYRPKPKALKMAILLPEKDKISTLKTTIEIKVKISGAQKSLTVHINDKKITPKNHFFSRQIDLKLGKNKINIQAKNKYQTIHKIYTIYRKTPLVLKLRSQRLMRISGKVVVQGQIEADKGVELFINKQKIRVKKGAFKQTVQLQKNQKSMLIKAISGKQQITKKIQIIADNSPLILTIDKPKNKHQTRAEKIEINGVLTGGKQVKLSLNQQPIDLNNQTFKQLVSLETGTNQFIFQATDQFNRKIIKKIIIEKVKPLKIIIAQGDYIVATTKTITLTGRIDGVLGEAKLTIDQQIISLKANGTFKYKVPPVTVTERKIQIVVSDKSQKTIKKTIRVIAE